MTSTYPRWAGDATPAFVAQFAKRLAALVGRVFVLAPHAKGAATHETKAKVRLKRFHYFVPASAQNIAYDGGAVGKVGKGALYAFKLVLYVTSLFMNGMHIVLTKKVHIINAHWIIPQGFVAIIIKLLTGAKVVVTVHGGDIFSLNSPLLVRVKRWVLGQADAVVVNSSATLAACQKVCPTAAYHQIPMGIDVGHFKPSMPSARLVERYGLAGFTVLFVGRLTQEKGAIFLCQALKKFKQKRQNFKALLVGDGPERARLERYIAAHNLGQHVTLVGWVEPGEIIDYYNAADVFVGPSIVSRSGWQEAMGLVFAEALAMGLPVVATNTGGIADVVAHGKTGFLVQQKSPQAIYDALTELYNDPSLRKRMSQSGRQHIEQHFAWGSVMSQYTKVFEDLV